MPENVKFICDKAKNCLQDKCEHHSEHCSLTDCRGDLCGLLKIEAHCLSILPKKKVNIPPMTHELLDALNEHEDALKALATSVSENTEITNSHKGEVALPFLDSAINDAFKLGWGACLKSLADELGIPVSKKEADHDRS